ncbi:MAG TPA: hypothetical protein VHQ90_06600 [Thermoanaerobaculia bacterium]|nr:hypothetical protein [Thermoanaerobaculia bacterium]
MPGSKNPIPPAVPPAPPTHTPPPIDLDQVTEATRRALYDATVAIHFRVPADTEDWMPFYNADQAGLTVWHGSGRWWAHWKALEETDNANLPPAAKHQLLRIDSAPGGPYGISYSEV